MYWRWRLNHTGVSFTSSPLDTGQGTGTDTCRAAHLHGGITGTTKLLVSAFPPHMCPALPVSGVGDVGLLTCLVLSLRLYFHECFKPALATAMGAAWVCHCPGLLASSPQLLCNHTKLHWWVQLDHNQPRTTERMHFLLIQLFPTPVHSLALGVNLVCLFWQWRRLIGRDVHGPLAWGKGWPGWGGPCWPQGIPAYPCGWQEERAASKQN